MDNKITTRQIAKICHAAIQAIRVEIGEEKLPDWENLDVGICASLEVGVNLALNDLRDGAVNPMSLHESWTRARVESGWVLGETIDHDKKTHPFLVPWPILPDAQKMKGYVFCGIVSGIFYTSYHSETGLRITPHEESKTYSQQEAEDAAQIKPEE